MTGQVGRWETSLPTAECLPILTLSASSRCSVWSRVNCLRCFILQCSQFLINYEGSEHILYVQVFRSSRSHLPGAFAIMGVSTCHPDRHRLCLPICHSWRFELLKLQPHREELVNCFLFISDAVQSADLSLKLFVWWHSFLTTAQLLQAVRPSVLTSVRCSRHSL